MGIDGSGGAVRPREALTVLLADQEETLVDPPYDFESAAESPERQPLGVSQLTEPGQIQAGTAGQSEQQYSFGASRAGAAG